MHTYIASYNKTAQVKKINLLANKSISVVLSTLYALQPNKFIAAVVVTAVSIIFTRGCGFGEAAQTRVPGMSSICSLTPKGEHFRYPLLHLYSMAIKPSASHPKVASVSGATLYLTASL